MTDLDIALAAAAVAGCAASLFSTLRYWNRCTPDDKRADEHYIEDIRALNTYNSYFLTAILIILGFTFEQGAKLPTTALILFLAALLAAGSGIFFFPVRRESHLIRRLWLWKLIPSQWTVILSLAGAIGVVLDAA